MLKPLNANGLRTLKIVHQLCACMWVGGATAMVLLIA